MSYANASRRPDPNSGGTTSPDAAPAIVGAAPTGYTIAGTGIHNRVREGYVLSGLRLTPVREQPALLLAAAALPLAARRRCRRVRR